MVKDKDSRESDIYRILSMHFLIWASYSAATQKSLLFFYCYRNQNSFSSSMSLVGPDCEPKPVSSRSLLHKGMMFCLWMAQWPWASLLSFLVLCSSAVKGGDGLGNSKVLSKFIILISEKIALAVPFPTSRLEPGSWHPWQPELRSVQVCIMVSRNR